MWGRGTRSYCCTHSHCRTLCGTAQLEALGKDYRVIAPDLRGFGGSSCFDGTPSVARMADDVAALLDVIGVEGPVAVGGLSMGGYVTLAFVHRYPQRVRALILADTRAEPDTDEGKVNRDKMIEMALTDGSLAVVQQMVPKLLGDTTKEKFPEIVEAVVTMGSAQSPRAVADALSALRDREDARPWLTSIHVPTLILVGSEDQITPPEMAAGMENAIRGAWLVHIKGAGHLSNLEQPEAFNQALLTFLRSNL